MKMYADWGGHIIKLTWTQSNKLPRQELITSVHGFCFYRQKLMLVDVDNRGWDIPGGHIENTETAESCFKREAMEEGYIEGKCVPLGYLEVNHQENPYWNEQSPYPEIGYQVFFRMDIHQLHSFNAEFESKRRIFISPETVSAYYDGWSELFERMLSDAIRLGEEK